jgi:hypothetical protein
LSVQGNKYIVTSVVYIQISVASSWKSECSLRSNFLFLTCCFSRHGNLLHKHNVKVGKNRVHPPWPPSHMFPKISSLSGVSIFLFILRTYYSVLRRGRFDLHNEQNGQNTIDKPIKFLQYSTLWYDSLNSLQNELHGLFSISPQMDTRFHG